MTTSTTTDPPEAGSGIPKLALLLAAAMFVLVVDTSLMNVSISAVVEDLDTTVSGVQSAIALEARAPIRAGDREHPGRRCRGELAALDAPHA